MKESYDVLSACEFSEWLLSDTQFCTSKTVPSYNLERLLTGLSIQLPKTILTKLPDSSNS